MAEFTVNYFEGKDLTGINSSAGIIDSAKILGYSGIDIPEEYMVRISDSRPDAYIESQGSRGNKQPKIIIIKAPLQEKITTRTESTWGPLSAASFVSGYFEGFTQLFSGRTLVNRFTSRRIWTGTSPLDFTLHLKFEAINNTDAEVTQPVKELHRMSLPYSGHNQDIKDAGTFGGKAVSFLSQAFLAPPGPRAFDIPGLKRDSNWEMFEGEIININIGKLLTFKKVIIKDITIEHMPKFEKGGASISAIAIVHFQTFEILTKETLDSMYSSGRKTVETINTEVFAEF